LACKYKYQCPKIVLKYRSSTSTSTKYNKTGTQEAIPVELVPAGLDDDDDGEGDDSDVNLS